MAIKVTGTTVINDSREVENIADVNRFIRTPEITSPTDGSTDRVVSINIEGTDYTPIFTADERLYREFQIDIDSGDFSSPERTGQVNSNIGDLQPNLNPDTSYKARIRDISINGTVSEWSEIVSFDTINVFVDEPTVSVPSSVEENPTINTSSFSVTNDTDTHESTDWEVIRTSDDVVVFESFNDTSNLTSITVTTDLDVSTEYEFRARHRGATFGTSNYGSVTATTVSVFSPQFLGEAYGAGFYMGTICTAGTTYYLLVAPNATGCACCKWGTTCTSQCVRDASSSENDGYGNTYPALTTSTQPAGNFTATRTIGGFSDWYLPAAQELGVFYDNGGGNGSGDPLPSGEDFDTADFYHSSRSASDSYACFFSFDSGGGNFRGGITAYRNIRAVRRIPITFNQ